VYFSPEIITYKQKYLQLPLVHTHTH